MIPAANTERLVFVASTDPVRANHNQACRAVLHSPARPYTIAGLLAGIALVALCLAATGIYGVVSYSVTQRTREIGVRMALGAHPRGVLRMVIGQGALPVVAGGIVGLLLALTFAYLMSTSVGFVDTRDPRTYAGVILSMVVVAFVASYVPARRASHVDPVIALRAE